MISGSNIGIQGGTFNSTVINQTSRTSRGMDIILEWVATGAFHDSDELYDAPKCHPNTRIAVLDDIMKWVESAQDDFMLWLFGPAGAGKSAIAKRIAELAAERGLLIADFFFSKSSSTRNNKDRLIATLAYQLAISIPDTRSYIEDAVERDPVIFKKNLLTQIDVLLIRPLQSSVSSTQIFPSQKLIIIDGLDECHDSQAQITILEAISRSFTQDNLPIKIIVASRPEINLVTLFTSNEPLKFIHRRIALDDTYRPDDDIRLFFSDKFQHIRLTHPLRSTIPITWPTEGLLDTLVKKSSGQFIYASTIVKFVESMCHRPTARLNIILGISPPGTINPFSELDAIYSHLLSSVDDIQITLRVLSLYVMMPTFVSEFQFDYYISPELFLSLEPGDIQLALINLSSIITYHESYGFVEVLHASLVDFLSDRRRSTTFHIDKASTCADFVCRILRYVQGPDGIQAGDIRLFHGVTSLCPWIPKGQLRNDILNFDLDTFINASIRWQYKEHPYPTLASTIDAFDIWAVMLNDAVLEDRDNKEALDQLNKSFRSRLQIYQSDWRLQLLFTLAVANLMYPGYYGVPSCRCLDILLEMDDHDLHLADQNALDLRHTNLVSEHRLIGVINSCLDGGSYASAALHCMHFLSNPPKHTGTYHEYYENMGPLIYAEWKAACDMTLEMLCKLLQQANALPELVQFISNHDIHRTVQEDFTTVHVWEVDLHILAFLSRTNMCPNWRIISAIQRSLIITYQPPSIYASLYAYRERRETRHLIQQRLDQCCSNIHQDDI